MKSLCWTRRICTPWLPLEAKIRILLELIGNFCRKVIFHHCINIIWGFYVIPMRYVFKLRGSRSKDRPKMRQFFRHFVNFK